jgi:hypothetical protein
MFSVFYDLETSDKNPIGQILNYSFILVDSDLTPIDELSGIIRISRLQLPDPGAILANRINVLDHQNVATEGEREALLKIVEFLEGAVRKAGGAVSFVGYNSSRFDLTYLRTSLVRNGFNPYFGGKLPSRDLLHVVQKAYLTSERFSGLIRKARSGEKKLSLSLQTVSQALDLLHGQQAHESREDVLLTIEVARWLKSEVGLDAATFEGYEGARLHSTARSGTVYVLSEPEYDLSADSTAAYRPVTLLDADHRSGLWVDLERYSESPTPRAIMWRSIARHAFFTSGQAKEDTSFQRIARGALTQFKGVNLRTFFTKSSCDIEQDIYRLDFDGINALAQAVHNNSKAPLEHLKSSADDAKVLWTRFLLAQPGDRLSDPRFAEMLKKYGVHRYGGKLQLVKSLGTEAGPEDYHPSLAQLLQRTRQFQDAALVAGKSDDLALLNALERFYQGSEIVRVAGNELFEGGWGSRAA